MCSQGNTPKTVSRLVQARPARSLLMPLLTVGPRGYQETPYTHLTPQSTVLPPRAQPCTRSCSNKHTLEERLSFIRNFELNLNFP